MIGEGVKESQNLGGREEGGGSQYVGKGGGKARELQCRYMGGKGESLLGGKEM